MNDIDTKNGQLAAKRAAFALIVFSITACGILFFEPVQLYNWVKALHVIAVMSWMAGMLYLPRLFVYHSDVPVGSERSNLLKIMELRLLKVIINPAMILSWILGLWLAWYGFKLSGGWLHAKILAVFILTGFHGYLAKSVKLFASDMNNKSSFHWRMVNEVPTVLMIIIVVLVIVKPFS
jgi:protoporphyrinogen IX oxidase